VLPPSEHPRDEQSAVVEDPEDPTSPLTQAAIIAVNAVVKTTRTRALLSIVKIGAIPLHEGNFKNLLPDS